RTHPAALGHPSALPEGQPEMTIPQQQNEPSEPPVTCNQASMRYGPGTHDARERYEELSMREHLSRAYAKLKASREYDPAKHGTGDTEPLTAADHLELLATELWLRVVTAHRGNVYVPSSRRPDSNGGRQRLY